jgi:hypothetical protein
MLSLLVLATRLFSIFNKKCCEINVNNYFNFTENRSTPLSVRQSILQVLFSYMRCFADFMAMCAQSRRRD